MGRRLQITQYSRALNHSFSFHPFKMAPSRKLKDRKRDWNEFLNEHREEGPPTKIYKPPTADKIKCIGNCFKKYDRFFLANWSNHTNTE